jgi:hypothetical protein
VPPLASGADGGTTARGPLTVAGLSDAEQVELARLSSLVDRNLA